MSDEWMSEHFGRWPNMSGLNAMVYLVIVVIYLDRTGVLYAEVGSVLAEESA
jgi:hypothetical protein